MDTEKLFKDIYQYVDSLDSVYIIGPSNKIKIRESLSLMKCHIEALSKDKEIKDFDPKTTPKIIEECLNFLHILVSEVELDESFCKFCSNYCFLSTNWNRNVFKNDIIDSKIQYILRVVTKALTVDDMLSILKHLDKKLKNQLSWRPPAFELSSHYYNLLKE